MNSKISKYALLGLTLVAPILTVSTYATDWSTPVKVSSVQIIDYPETFPKNLLGKEYINARVFLWINSSYNLSGPVKVETYLLSGSDSSLVYYYNTQYVTLIPGQAKYVDIKIPTSTLLSKEDSLLLRINTKAILIGENGTLFETEANDTKTITLIDALNTADLKVSIYPNLSILEDATAKDYTFKIYLTNYGVTDKQLTIDVRVLDVYDNIVKEKIKEIKVPSNSQVSTLLDVDLSGLSSGKYTTEIIIKEGDTVVYKKVQDTYINPTVGNAIKFYKVELFPENPKPGDLVLVKLYIKNIWNKDIEVTPEVISSKLNIYKTLDTFTLKAGEVKVVKVVIPFDAKTPGLYPVNIRFNYDTFRSQTYTLNLYVPGQEEIINAYVSGPTTLEIGKEGLYTLTLTSEVEDLIPIKIEVEAYGAKVLLPKSEVYLGGKGYTKIINFAIEPTQENGQVIIKLIDERNDKVLKTFTIEVKGIVHQEQIQQNTEENKTKVTNNETQTTTTPIIDKTTLILLAIIILILIVAILYVTRRGGSDEEEKPTE